MKSLKTLSLILIAFLFLLTTACGNSGGSADSAKASTMRLVRTEGVVSLSDEEGESIPVEIDMRLFSGNAISTEVESRAGISLDDAKTATLDEKSLARLHQDGKMLSLNLEDGALYFNVSKPLDEDESFEISTSTMTLGIRGTAGYVAAVDENTCRIILATGHAVITAIDGKTQEISGAQQVLVTITPTGAEFTVLPIRPDAYPAILTEGLLADQIVSGDDFFQCIRGQ